MEAMNVTVYGPLRSPTGGKHAEIDFSGGTVRGAIAVFVSAYPRAEPQLYDGDGLRSSVRVTVDGEAASFDDTCPADAALTLHPAVQGG
jgi:molybdopterin synthase sulfur carrier subunit